MSKILIIRFSSIGDIVLTTPIIRCVKTQIEDAEVHVLVKKGYESILDYNPHITKIHVYDNNILDLLRSLYKERFHLVIDLQKNLKSQYLSFRLGVEAITFDKLNFKKFLLTTFKIDKLPRIHIVDRYFNALQTKGVTNDGKGLEFNISNIDRVGITDLVPINYNVLVLGATHFTKRIPASKCQEIISLSKLPIVLIGGKDVEVLGQQLQLSAGKDQVINLCGRLSIGQSAAWLDSAIKVITADTGMMHIAAALNKNIDVFWGNTTPVFGMFPYLPLGSTSTYTNHQVEELSCRPCSKLGSTKCPKGHFNCMMLQDVSKLDL
jgi:ADP-heptose:LPS heptosyltransferase